MNLLQIGNQGMLKQNVILTFTTPDPSIKFHGNLFTSFWVIGAYKQTDKQTNTTNNITSLATR